MPTATDRAKTASTHWKVIKNNKIERKKILQEENDKIDRILRSPAFTDADKERNFQQRERNLTEIIKLSDEINKIDNDLLPPSGSYPLKRGRSQTRGPNRRCASPSPIQRSPRSASSSVPRRRSDQIDDDKLRKVQDQLDEAIKENKLLRRELYAESSRYGDDIYHFNSKIKDMGSDVSYRLRLQNADLSIQHQNISKENKDLRDMNYKLSLDSEILSRRIQQLEAEKEIVATMLQDQKTKITRYKLAVVELEYDNDLIRDEKDRFTIEKKSLYGEIEELSRRLRQLEVNYKSEADVLISNQSDLENRVQHLQAENERIQRHGETERKGAEELRRVLSSEKRNSDELRDRIKDLERSCQEMLKYKEMLQEYEVENERLLRENTETLKQLQSRNYYKNIAGKTEDNNAILRGRLKIETEEKARLQRENNTLKTQIASAIREIEWSSKNNLEELEDLQNKNDELKENLELMQKAYQRERIYVTTLQQKENEMKQKIHEIIKRNQNLENEKQKQKASFSSKRDHEKEISRLHSVVRDKDLVEDRLRNKIEELEKKNNEIQSRTDKRLRDIEEHERGSQHLKEENDKELNRLRQLEINYKSEAEVLRSNQTDLENKVEHLQAEKERLQQNGETERQAAEELQRALYAEKRNSNELRDRIKDLERFKEQEIHYKSETEILRSNHTDLEKKVQNLQTETKRLQRNGEMERKVAEELRCELDSEKGKSDEFRDRIKDLERLLRIEEKGREQLKQDSDKELNRLRQLEINYKIEKETLRSNHTDLEKKVKQLQDEKERLLQNEQSERKLAEKLKRELDAEKRDSNKIHDRLRYLERESSQSIEKLETGRKQILDEKDRELIRLRRSENDYKNKTDTLKHELADLRKDFALLQEEKDELIHSKKTEMKKAKDVQKELDDARREEAKFRYKIKELEKHMVTVPKVDPSMSEENSRLKEDLKHIGIELQNAQERLTQLEINNKIEAASHTSNQTALEKKVKQLQDEKEKLLQNEEMKRKLAEKIKSESGDRDPERERLRRLENVYKNETDTLKHELADLKKNIELLQEEKEELAESEETERKIAETLQNELDDAKREKLMLQDRIKELQRQMNRFPKVDPSMPEENSRLKEDLKHLGTELQKAQQKITGNEESVRHYMRQVETLQREKQQAIAEKESALTRLSALAGDRLRDNNAAIADLSDENRPINLGEKFSELYDNQWTDAIEKLEKLMTERDAIQKLLSMVQEIYCACKDIAKEQLDLIAKAFGLEGRKEKLKRLKDFRKSMAPDNLQDIKERVNSSCVSKDFSQEAAYCASYINRSVELCWYMCIQDPPVVLEFKASHGDVFNDKIYRHFTKSGRTIDYMVWPVMYLHSNGPLLQKGVVQPV